MAKKEDRQIITLACTECKERTYTTSKNRRNDPERLELSKFCPRCRLHNPPGVVRYLCRGARGGAVRRRLRPNQFWAVKVRLKGTT